MRLDLFLFENNYVKSRQKAKTLITEGNVKVDNVIIDKPSYNIDENVEHTVEITNSCPYVSRGGLKLEKLLSITKIDVSGKVCLDIGASTGGFTHCLLLNGAKRVYAVDSGTNQLAEELLSDERVVSYENFNARNISVNELGETVDIITIDVSFISQNLIIPNASRVLNDNGVYLSLIKPQFEAGRQNIGKGGIVKSKKARLEAVMSVISCAKEHSLFCNALAESPIQGGDGNVEYIASFSKNGQLLDEKIIKKIVLE